MEIDSEIVVEIRHLSQFQHKVKKMYLFAHTTCVVHELGGASVTPPSTCDLELLCFWVCPWIVHLKVSFYFRFFYFVLADYIFHMTTAGSKVLFVKYFLRWMQNFFILSLVKTDGILKTTAMTVIICLWLSSLD